MDQIEFIKDTHLESSSWIKIKQGKSKKNNIMIGTIYMPTQSNTKSINEQAYKDLKQYKNIMTKSGQIILLGDFNARVGNNYEDNYIIGSYGK